MKQKAKNIFVSTTGKECRTISELTDGFSNENYLINCAYVLRLPKENSDPTIDRRLENKIYNSIEPLLISEKVINFDEETGVKISKFVHNAHPYINKPTLAQLNYVVKTLKKLHNSSLNVNKDYQLLDKLNVYKSVLNESQFIDKEYENNILEEYKKVSLNEDLVLCHNDLVKGNMLFKHNGVVLIDWEYASMNYPYFDLASLISENNLDEESANFVIQKYYGCRLTIAKKKKVQLFIKILDILFYYRAAYFEKVRGDKIYTLIKDDKLSRIEHDKI